jgi:hypothetical protein
MPLETAGLGVGTSTHRRSRIAGLGVGTSTHRRSRPRAWAWAPPHTAARDRGLGRGHLHTPPLETAGLGKGTSTYFRSKLCCFFIFVACYRVGSLNHFVTAFLFFEMFVNVVYYSFCQSIFFAFIVLKTIIFFFFCVFDFQLLLKYRMVCSLFESFSCFCRRQLFAANIY